MRARSTNTSPLWWVLEIPNEIRHAILESRASHDPAVVSLDYVEQVRWYERGVVTVSSGARTETFFVLVYLGGRYRVVLDADNALRLRLMRAKLLPARPIWLGTSHKTVAWFAWFVMLAILATIVVAIVMVLRNC
jgi:hypothetical protein